MRRQSEISFTRFVLTNLNSGLVGYLKSVYPNLFNRRAAVETQSWHAVANDWVTLRQIPHAGFPSTDFTNDGCASNDYLKKAQLRPERQCWAHRPRSWSPQRPFDYIWDLVICGIGHEDNPTCHRFICVLENRLAKLMIKENWRNQ